VKQRAALSLILFMILIIAVTGCTAPVCVDISIDMSKMHTLQEEVDHGYTSIYLDPIRVIQEFLVKNLGIEGALIQRVDSASDDLALGKAEYTVKADDGREYRFYLTKPTRNHPTGIWAVEKYCEEK